MLAMDFNYNAEDSYSVQLAKQRERHYHLRYNEFRVLNYLHMRCGKKLKWGEKHRAIALNIFRSNSKSERDRIQRIINSLAKKGFIQKEKYAKNRKFYTRYVIDPSNNWELPEVKNYDAVTEITMKKPSIDDAENRQNLTENSTNNANNEIQESVKIKCPPYKNASNFKGDDIITCVRFNDNNLGGKIKSEDNTKKKSTSLSNRKLVRNKNTKPEDLESFYEKSLEAYKTTMLETFKIKSRKQSWTKAEKLFFETIPREYTDETLIEAILGYSEESQEWISKDINKSFTRKISVILRFENSRKPETIYTRIEDCSEHYREKQRIENPADNSHLFVEGYVPTYKPPADPTVKPWMKSGYEAEKTEEDLKFFEEKIEELRIKNLKREEAKAEKAKAKLEEAKKSPLYNYDFGIR